MGIEFDDDGAALNAIEENYIIPKGFIIQPKVDGYKPTELEGAAIDYLCAEWDFGYSPRKL